MLRPRVLSAQPARPNPWAWRTGAPQPRRRCVACMAAAGAGSPAAAPAPLSPRQRKLAAKRRTKEQARQQQQQQQQQQSHSLTTSAAAPAPTAAPPQLKKPRLSQPQPPPQQQPQKEGTERKRRTSQQQEEQQQLAPVTDPLQSVPPPLLSLTDCCAALSSGAREITNAQKRQQLEALAPDTALALLLAWADQTRTPPGAAVADSPSAAAAVAALLPTLRAGAADGGCFDRQQLADAAWGLAHFRGQLPSDGQEEGGPVQWAAELEEVMAVPFRVLPRALTDLSVEEFWAELELHLKRDVIYLDGGARAVEEVRMTCWQSDIGATFKYSGKEMMPAPGGLTPRVAAVRDRLTKLTGHHYDSVLINYYEDGKCGMRYHVDPLYGAWTPNTSVVSLGATRRFVFREAQDHSVRWGYRVSCGDVVEMFGDCQDRLQHAVKVERRAEDAGPRISLVYKQRLKTADGRYIGL